MFHLTAADRQKPLGEQIFDTYSTFNRHFLQGKFAPRLDMGNPPSILAKQANSGQESNSN
jgi:hypothetical protein